MTITTGLFSLLPLLTVFWLSSAIAAIYLAVRLQSRR
jgi:hypothetical protein